MMENKIYILKLFCSSAVSNEEWNIIRKFKPKQKKRDVYNKYNDQYSQLEPAKKKQRYSSMDRAKKDELLETCAKNIKKWMRQKRSNFLRSKETNINTWTFHTKKVQLLCNKIAEYKRIRYHSIDCTKKKTSTHWKKSLISNSSTKQRTIQNLMLIFAFHSFARKYDRVFIMYALSATGYFVETVY